MYSDYERNDSQQDHSGRYNDHSYYGTYRDSMTHGQSSEYRSNNYSSDQTQSDTGESRSSSDTQDSRRNQSSSNTQDGWRNQSSSTQDGWQKAPSMENSEADCKEQADTKPKKKHPFVRAIAIVCCLALLAGAIGTGARYILNSRTPSAHTTVLAGTRKTASLVDIDYVDTTAEMSYSDIYDSNVNSTVGISTQIQTNYFGYQTTSAAAGSGFILTEDGYILTNYHVVESATTITVTLYDGTAYEASLIGYDSNNDIAVLKIDATGLVPVILGDSDQMRVGEEVLAIGNPLGELTFSLTRGIISAKDRTITLSNTKSMALFQTDCAINSGNSGGALFNMHGEVIGITNAKYSSNAMSSEASIDNIGFAIPINSVKAIVLSIVENGYYVKPYLGISVGNVSAEAQSYGLPAGAAVAAVIEGSPAEAAGLQANDIITEVDGTAITGSSDLIKIVQKSTTGTEMTLTVYRQGETMTLTVVVGEQIQDIAAEKAAAESEAAEAQQNQQNQQNNGNYYYYSPFGQGQGSNGFGFFPWDYFGY